MKFDFVECMNTNTATFVVFEVAEVAALADTVDWWVDNTLELRLMQEGRTVFIEVAMDGFFSFRLTNGELREEEEVLIRQTEDRFWLDVKGSELIFGASGALPKSLDTPEEYIEEYGVRIPFEPGRYHIIIHRLIEIRDDGIEDDDIVVDEDLEIDEEDDSGPPAYVIQFRPFMYSEEPPLMEQIPRLSPFVE